MSVVLVQSLSTILVPFSSVGYFSIVLARFQVVCASVMGDIAGLVRFLPFVCLCSLFPFTFVYISHVLLYSLNQIFPTRYLTHTRSELVSLLVILSSPFTTVDLDV